MKKVSFNSLFTGLSLFLLIPAQTYAGGLNVPSNVKLDRVECGQAPKAYAYISWNPVEFATSYRFYSKGPEQSFEAYDEITTNSYKLGFNPELDVKIAVSAVNTFNGATPTHQVSESDKSGELTLSARELSLKCKNTEEFPTQAVVLLPTDVVITPATPSAQPKAGLTRTPTPTLKAVGTLRANDIEMSEYAASPSAVAAKPTTEEMFGSLVKWIKVKFSLFN